MTHLFKYLHGSIDSEYTNALSLVHTGGATNLRSSGHGPKLLRVHINTETYKGFYFNRIVNMWNNLPPDIRCCTSIRNFKTELAAHYFTSYPIIVLMIPVHGPLYETRCQICRGQN